MRKTSARLQFTNAFIVLLVGGHLFCLVFGVEIWPFSHYPMFSAPRQEVVRGKGFYGITADGKEDFLNHRGYFSEQKFSILNHIGRNMEYRRNVLTERDYNNLMKALFDWYLIRKQKIEIPEYVGFSVYNIEYNDSLALSAINSPDKLEKLGSYAK